MSEEYEKQLDKEFESFIADLDVFELKYKKLFDKQITEMKDILKSDIESKDKKRSKAEDGFFDNITTWTEAIHKMEELGSNQYVGHFEEIDGNIYFKLCMKNNYLFDSKLLSENYLMAHPNYRRTSKKVPTAWDKLFQND